MNRTELPKEYSLLRRIDWSRDRRVFLGIEIGQLLLLIGLGFLGFAILPERMVSRSQFLLQLAVLCLGIGIVALGHEALHAAGMRLAGHASARLRLPSWRLRAVSPVYFDRRTAVGILLLPPIGLGLLLLGLNLAVPAAWQWTVYGLQVLNAAAAWEDFCLALCLSRFDKHMLLQFREKSLEIYTVTDEKEKG